MTASLTIALLVLTPALPAAVATLWSFAPLRSRLLPVVPWVALPALVLALTPVPSDISWSIPGMVTGLRFGLDGIGRTFLLLTGLLWLLAGLFALSYHRSDPARERFFGFFVLTMTGNLGLVVAADILSFYLFFACMTYGAYGLVVHHRDPEAFRAGRVYIALAVLGELGVLTALFLLGSAGGGAPGFGSELAEAWSRLAAEGRSDWVATLLVVGFGVKAGLVPLHGWLPLAHPAAPTAASALLSGTMIKAGLLAWIRYMPPGEALPIVGTALVALGVWATLYGVVLGLAQDDAKTMLAYSSVSQMGFMTVGTGLVARTSDVGPAALLVLVAYALHHAVAKAALFLSVGVASRVRKGTLRARGHAAGRTSRGMILLGAALPALALSGAPFSAGAQAKGTLKRAISDLAPELATSLGIWLMVAAAGTTLLMARFLLVLAERMSPVPDADVTDTKQGGDVPPGMVVPWMALLALGMVAPLWLPHALPVGWAPLLPGAAYEWMGAAGPVLAGMAIAWVVARRPGLLGRLREFRVPPGDVVVPFERLAHRMGAPPVESWAVRSVGWIRYVRAAQVRAHSLAAYMADNDLRLAAGRFVAPLLFALFLVGLASLIT